MITRLVDAITEVSPEVVLVEAPPATLVVETSPDLPGPIVSEERPGLADQGVRDLVRVFKLLSDETRLKILLYLIQRGELNVRSLCQRLRQSQPAVSHHLALLRVAGLVDCRREGKHNFYRVLPERFQRMLDTVFETVPAHERQIQFQDYVLRQTRGE